ncbi:MAG: hypothetical protein K6G19_05135 [Lachnospiraceae bacterium]|nr:hypothetical protein [Lachnospiraceae bacterium]
MRRKMIALCDPDSNYLTHLQENLEQRENFPFVVNTYTNAISLKESMKEFEYEVVLAAEEAFKELRKDVGDSLVLLKEKGTKCDADDFIWKYQSAENIRKEILEHCAEKGNLDAVIDECGRHTRLIGVFSPVGKDVQTSFSLLLGQFLAKKKKVLYLNLEPFSGLSYLDNAGEGRDLTDLIYYMNSGKDKLQYKLESMINRIGELDYVAPAFSFIDLAQIESENWILLLKMIMKYGKYDYLILDLSEIIQGVLNVLRECDVIYTISQREGMGAVRMKQYEELLGMNDLDDVLERTSKCEMPVFTNLPNGIEELPYTELAGYVRSVAEEELERVEQ